MASESSTSADAAARLTLVAGAELLPHPAQLVAEGLGVLGARVSVQIRLPGRRPLPEPAGLHQHGAAIAQMRGRVRVDQQEAIDDAEGAVPCLLSGVDGLEVSEHADDD